MADVTSDESPSGDLDSLFTRDPLSLTRPDRKAIIDYYASARERHVAAQEQGKRATQPKALGTAAPPKKKMTMEEAMDLLGGMKL